MSELSMKAHLIGSATGSFVRIPAIRPRRRPPREDKGGDAALSALPQAADCARLRST